MTQEQAKQTKQPTPKPSSKKKAQSSKSRGTVITLRILKYAGIPILLLVCLYVGLYIGYVTIGDQPPGEIWEWSTWRHMYDLVFAEAEG